MKKNVLLGTALALVALLMFSCNKNRFDLDQLDTVEGSGQWKLPIGSVSTTLGKVLNQFGENDLISYDEQGNLQVCYKYAMENILTGSSFLNLGTLNFSTDFVFNNPFPGVMLPEPIDTTMYFQQVIELVGDSVGIESAIIKSGTLQFTVMSGLGVNEVTLSSPDILMPNGEPLQGSGNMIDLAGATFRLHDPVTGEADSTLVLDYAINFHLEGVNEAPQFEVTTIIGLNDLKIQELSGFIDHYVYDFEYDTAFSLSLDNVVGQMKLVGAKISINEKNTFGGLNAALIIDQAEFYGGGATPAPIFNQYPFELSVVPSPTYINVLPDETLDLEFNTAFDAVRFAARLDLNPNSVDQLVTIVDTAKLGIAVDAVIPMQFNVPGVSYLDTLDLNLSDISAPEFVKELILGITFDSQLPFNISAQLYPYNSNTGQTDEPLLADEIFVAGSFDGIPVVSKADVSITKESLQRLLAADKLIMELGVNTDNQDVMLNLDNAFGMTLKADVIYGGGIDLNN